MALSGYSALGGCECGCGVSCKVVGYDHARWVCPGSVGYTCADADDNIGAALLFADEPDQARPRAPPCGDLPAQQRLHTRRQQQPDFHSRHSGCSPTYRYPGAMHRAERRRDLGDRRLHVHYPRPRRAPCHPRRAPRRHLQGAARGDRQRHSRPKGRPASGGARPGRRWYGAARLQRAHRRERPLEPGTICSRVARHSAGLLIPCSHQRA